MTPTVVGIAGAIGSGKSTVATALANQLGCPIASFGSYVRSVATMRGIGHSRTALQAISEELLDSIGLKGLIEETLIAAKWAGNQSLVIDGIRHPEMIAALRDRVAPLQLKIIYLAVEELVRSERVLARDALSEEQLLGFDRHSTERDVGTRVRELADHVIDANGSAAATLALVVNAIDA